MCIVVLVTVPSEEARRMARVLLERRLCACVNLIKGVESYFWWEGKIDTAKETLLVIKTQKKLFKRLEEVVKENHPYTTPEIVSLRIDDMSLAYKKWLVKETEDA